MPDNFETHEDLVTDFAQYILSKISKSDEINIDIPNDVRLSRDYFYSLSKNDFLNENQLLLFLREVFELIEEYSVELIQRYEFLLNKFIQKYNLHYDLSNKKIVPSISGMLASTQTELERIVQKNEHSKELWKNLCSAQINLYSNPIPSQLSPVINSIFIVLEMLVKDRPEVNKKTFGDAVKQIDSVPHATIRNAFNVLYGFASDYPGIRHSGTQEGKIRDLEIKDFIAMQHLMLGMVPYLTDEIDYEKIYFARDIK